MSMPRDTKNLLNRIRKAKSRAYGMAASLTEYAVSLNSMILKIKSEGNNLSFPNLRDDIPTWIKNFEKDYEYLKKNTEYGQTLADDIYDYYKNLQKEQKND